MSHRDDCYDNSCDCCGWEDDDDAPLTVVELIEGIIQMAVLQDYILRAKLPLSVIEWQPANDNSDPKVWN